MESTLALVADDSMDVVALGRAARALRIIRVLRGIRATRVLSQLILQRRSESTMLAATQHDVNEYGSWQDTADEPSLAFAEGEFQLANLFSPRSAKSCDCESARPH